APGTGLGLLRRHALGPVEGFIGGDVVSRAAEGGGGVVAEALERFHKGGAGSVVAVVDEHAARLFREAFQPGKQAVAVGVAADAGKGAHLGGDADVLAKELDLLRALDDLAAERALGLIADEEY